MNQLKLLFVVQFLLVTQLVSGQDKAELKVSITNFDIIEGEVHIGLYNSADTYMKKSLLAYSKKVDSETVEIVFQDLPFGDYSFSIYHDANSNGEMDTNIIGIPKEDYAFSNNADGRFGPPEYAQSVFEINSPNAEQTINLN